MLGVLEVAGRGSGFLRRREASYLPSHGDVHVGERLIRQFARGRKLADGFRKVAIRAAVPADYASHPRQHMMEVRLVGRANDR